MSDFVTIILAAGKGTRMKSALPKVLHKAGGKAMVQQVLDAAKAAGARRQVVVTGFGGDAVREALGDQAEFVTQEEQLGTGHAVKMTAPLLKDEKGTVMVEAVFGYPGIGNLAVESAKYHDYNMLMVTVLLTGAFVFIASFAAQTINEEIDPRMKVAKEIKW